MIDLLSNIYLYILSSYRWSSRNKFPNRDGRPERRNVGRSILSSILDSCVWLHDCIDYRADRRVLIGGYAIRKIRFRKKDSRYLEKISECISSTVNLDFIFESSICISHCVRSKNHRDQNLLNLEHFKYSKSATIARWFRNMGRFYDAFTASKYMHLSNW